MAGACVNDTDTIELVLVGSPPALEANVRNRATTFSGTFGDDTTHPVNDADTPHTLAQTFNIKNGPGGLAATAVADTQGIVVVELNPIFVHAVADITLTVVASLIIDSVLADQRDIPALGLDVPAGTSMLLGLGGLVGQFDLPIGGDEDIDVSIVLENIGASGSWSFRFGGSKLVATLGY